jgi:hypothetical protein
VAGERENALKFLSSFEITIPASKLPALTATPVSGHFSERENNAFSHLPILKKSIDPRLEFVVTTLSGCIFGVYTSGKTVDAKDVVILRAGNSDISGDERNDALESGPDSSSPARLKPPVACTLKGPSRRFWSVRTDPGMTEGEIVVQEAARENI